MNGSRFRIFFRMFMLASTVFSFVWITKLVADDVYNFYFQKGGAPNTVVQGGGGQTAAATASTSLKQAGPEKNPAIVTPSEETKVVPKTAATLSQNNESERTRKPFQVTLGYAGLKDKIGSGKAFTMGFQYNFNPYLGARLLGRMRDFQADDSRATSNRLGGMLAFVLTPFRLDLFGHRLLEVSVLAGADTSRKFVNENSNVGIAINPMAGASALLSINENFGIELLASKSTEASLIGLNLALLF